MKICSYGHDEVCYEGNICPCCELIKDQMKLEDKIYTLEDEVANLKAEVNQKED